MEREILRTPLFALGLFCLLTPVFARVKPPHSFEIELGGSRFDPLVTFGRESLRNSKAGEERLFLIQLHGLTNDEVLQRMEAEGLTPVRYLHPYAYVVWGDPAVISRGEENDFFRWIGEFEVEQRVSAELLDNGRSRERVDLLFYRGGNLSLLNDRFLQLLGEIPEHVVVDRDFYHLTFMADSSQVLEIASVPGVYTIQKKAENGGVRGEFSNQIIADNLDLDRTPITGYETWLGTLGLDGSGVVLANVDLGVDQDHPDLLGNVSACVGSSCPQGNSASTHGTHTAAIIAGTGASGVVDSQGFLKALGVAPGASLIEQIFTMIRDQPGYVQTLMTQSHRNGAVISSNSWGPNPTPRGYDADTMMVDIGIRDADSAVVGNQALIYVLSVMNGNGGYQSQGTPDEGKNHIAVGATLAQPDGSIPLSGQITDLCAKTTHGPSLDGRFLTDVVAPGCSVESADTNSRYTHLSGTSMAAPHVSGGIALFLESWRNSPLGPDDPSPALVKAAVLASAKNLKDNLDADGGTLGTRPDMKQGWGFFNLKELIDPSVDVYYFDQEHVFTESGQFTRAFFEPSDPGFPIEIMLTWTDAPGHGLGGVTPAWNNDLDLIAKREGHTYPGNLFDENGWSRAGVQTDYRNNEEGVFFAAGSSEFFEVRIDAAHVNSDGVPGNASGLDQDYALVCRNCTPIPFFTLEADEEPLSVCLGETPTFDVSLIGFTGFNETVELSYDAPQGVTVSLPKASANVGENLEIGLSFDPGLEAGVYEVRISGQSPSRSYSVVKTVYIFEQAPQVLHVGKPGHAMQLKNLYPEFSWVHEPGAVYHFQIALDENFENLVYDAEVNQSRFRLDQRLQPDTGYFWRVKAENPCGEGPYSLVRSFQTSPLIPVLFVDDDDNNPDVLTYYTGILDQLSLAHDTWDTSTSQNEPGIDTLQNYRMVIWASGDSINPGTPRSGPNQSGELALTQWLELGSRTLMLSAQDYAGDMGDDGQSLTTFMTDYLGIESFLVDSAYLDLVAEGSFAKFGSFHMNQFPSVPTMDVFTPKAEAVAVLNATQGDAASFYEVAGSQSWYFAFPFENMRTEDRTEILREILKSAGLRTGCGARIDYQILLDQWPDSSILGMVECLAAP